MKWFSLWVCAFCLLVTQSDPVHAGKINYVSDANMAREMYDRVNKTRPSAVNKKGHEAVIRSRLKCYAKHHDIATRIGTCNNLYTTELIRLARKNITAKPTLGKFVLSVRMCPIMYNMCMGKTKHDEKSCVTFERQCIDHVLDVYWRGSKY